MRVQANYGGEYRPLNPPSYQEFKERLEVTIIFPADHYNEHDFDNFVRDMKPESVKVVYSDDSELVEATMFVDFYYSCAERSEPEQEDINLGVYEAIEEIESKLDEHGLNPQEILNDITE